MTVTLERRERIVEMLEHVTGLKFLIDGPSCVGESKEGQVWCANSHQTGRVSSFVRRCWEDNGGDVWLESPQFLDVVRSIEKRYRTSVVERAKKFDYAGFDRDEVQRRFAGEFLLPDSRIA